MTRFLLIFSLAATAVMTSAQSTGTPQQLPTLRDRNQQQQPATQSSTTPAGDAVIVIRGLCSAPASDPNQCTTVISRQQFETLLDALNTSNRPVSPETRRKLAQDYVDVMTTAQAAEKAGIDKDPRFTESMRVLRMRLLTDSYLLALEQRSTPSAGEILGYYNQNQSKFEEVSLSRVWIPARNPGAANKVEWETKVAQLTGTIHDRAVKGESFEILQREAFATLGLQNPQSTVLKPIRRRVTPSAEEQEIFSLQVGGVSPVEQESGGNAIYRMEGRQVLPLDNVKDEIARTLAQTKADAQMKAIRTAFHADLSSEYFGPEPAPAAVAPTLQRPAPPK
ncbi:MAG TPA: peptidylprolyl isomerase [Candidatus Angelobacter sp.]|nr:peptidylprolyl isomerase [Candidatus Angelobacter sp.]